MAPALVLCRRRSKARGVSVCLSVRRLQGGARRCFQATRCPFQTPARRGESPMLRWRGRVLLLGENTLGGSRARNTGRGCISVQGASKFSWWPGEEPGRSHFALAEVCGITQRTRVAPFIPPSPGHGERRGSRSPPNTSTPLFPTGRVSSKLDPLSQRWGRKVHPRPRFPPCRDPSSCPRSRGGTGAAGSPRH